MNPEQMQGTPVDMTPEDAKASLGLATRMSEQMLMMQNPQPTETTEPQAPESQGQQIDPQMIADMVKQAVKEGLSGIQEEIAKVIEDEKD